MMGEAYPGMNASVKDAGAHKNAIADAERTFEEDSILCNSSARTRAIVYVPQPFF
jgi:hypothetical protein